jgi:hypothetical protein
VGKFSKDKGARSERFFVNKLKGAGIDAKRVPLSGAMANYPHDINLAWPGGGDRAFEAKHRADGFKEIYKWLKPADGLFIRADRQEGLAVLRMADFCDLLNAALQADMLKREICTESGWVKAAE